MAFLLPDGAWPYVGYASAAVSALGLIVPSARRAAFEVVRNVYRDWRLMRGYPAIPGLNPGVPPLRQRMATVEAILPTLVTKDEHADLVEAVKRLDDGQLEILDRITPNGGDTDTPGDVLLRIAKALGVDDAHKTRTRRRRAGDHPTAGGD